MSFLKIITILAVSAVLVQIASVPLKHTLWIVADPMMLSYRRANLSYYKFYKWFRRQRPIEQFADWITLFPVWGYLFYIIGQIGRWLFDR